MGKTVYIETFQIMVDCQILHAHQSINMIGTCKYQTNDHVRWKLHACMPNVSFAKRNYLTPLVCSLEPNVILMKWQDLIFMCMYNSSIW